MSDITFSWNGKRSWDKVHLNNTEGCWDSEKKKENPHLNCLKMLPGHHKHMLFNTTKFQHGLAFQPLTNYPFHFILVDLQVLSHKYIQ